MKFLMPPEADKIEGSITLNSSTTASDPIKLWGVERVGSVVIEWSGTGGNLSLDILVSCEPLSKAVPTRFESVLSTPMDDDGVTQVTSVCANWIKFDGDGTTWGSDTVIIDYLLKCKNIG